MLTLLELTKGNIPLDAILEMDLDDFDGWLEDAFEFRKEMNKAIERAAKGK